MHGVRLTCLGVLTLLQVACATSGAPPSTGSEYADEGGASQFIADEYRIGPGDVLQVNVWRNPDLSVEVPVRPDGMITAPLIGDVRASGNKPEEVAATIKTKLDDYLFNPNVTVIVSKLLSGEYLSRVRVTGAVENPLSIPYRQGMTVLDVVLEAGGVTDFAAPDRTKLYRRSDSATKVLEIQLGEILDEGELDSNVALRPGDVISVPERLF